MYLIKRVKHKLKLKSKQKLSKMGLCYMISQQIFKQILNLIVPGIAATIGTIIAKRDV